MDTELIKLLKLAQGDRSLNAFARHADISPGNLSRIMNGQKATPETLKKIANKAHNNVTYAQLMMAAGYIATNNKKSKNIKQSQKYTTEDEELLNDISSLDDDLKKEAKKYIELLKLKQNIDKGKSEQSATSEKDA